MQIMSVIKSQKSSSFLLQNASATNGLGLSSSLLLCALRPFPTWVDISQQCLMYIWPLMLSLHVPEPEAQLKLTTPEALPPSLEPTPCLFRLFLPHPLLFPSYIVPLGSSPRALLLLCASAPSSPPHLWFPPPLCYSSSPHSFICSAALTRECLPCFAASSPFSIVTWQSIIYGHTDSALPPIWVIAVLETSELQFQHIAHFLTWYTVRFMWRQYPVLIYSF